MGKKVILWKNMWETLWESVWENCGKVFTDLKNSIFSIKEMCRSGRCTHYLHIISTVIYTVKNIKNTLVATRFCTISTGPTTTTTNIFIERSF